MTMPKRTFILRAIGASIGLWFSIVAVQAFAGGTLAAERAASLRTHGSPVHQVTFRR